MAVNQQAIDRIKLDEAFATETYMPFNDCWTVSMDSELMVIDDEDKKYSRFTNDPSDAQKALMVINENNRQIVLLSIDNKLIKEHVGGICDCALFDDKNSVSLSLRRMHMGTVANRCVRHLIRLPVS